MFIRKLSSLLLIGAIVFSFAACSSEGSQPSVSDTTSAVETAASPAADNSDDIFVSAYPAFAVTSQSLHDGKWDEITETSLPEGWAPSSDYAGPRPQPGITHKYNVYVFALKNPVERAKGGVRSTSPKVQEFMDALDTDINGNTGNIIAVGRVSGTYTAK